MRVNFGNKEKQIEFFKKVKPVSISWRQFYRITNNNLERKLSRRTFRNWYEGRNLPPMKIVKTICRIFNYKLVDFQFELLPENWGVILGGKSKSRQYKCNLTKEQRIKGSKNGMKSLRRKFGKEKMKKVSSYAGCMSVKSNKSYLRKTIGPKGEKMFNELEKEVAEILLKLGLDYKYEDVLHLKNRHIVPDFIINQILIECTYFWRIDQKARTLKEKFNKILNETKIDRIVVITKEEMKSEYNSLLGAMVDVITPKELPEWIMTQS